VAGRQRPSFLKKQKEEQRRARATRKREERRARRQAGPVTGPEVTAPEEVAGAAEEGEGREPETL
jgi:hypothetical protein